MTAPISDNQREQIEELIESAEDQLEAIRAGLNAEDYGAAHRAADGMVEAVGQVRGLVPGEGES